MATNVVVAAFGASKIVRTRGLYQWDYGQVLKFAGLDLPNAYTVHFSDDGVGGTAKTMVGDENGVTIPDEYLTTGKTVYAWVYLHTGADDGETVYSVIIPVVARPQPTEEEPTPVQHGVIDQAIAALNSAVEQTAADVETTGDNATAAQTAQSAAETAQGQAEGYAGDAAQSAADAAQSVTDAAGSATAAGQSAGQAAQSAQDAAGSATSAAGSAEAAEDASQAVQDMGVAAESLAPGSEATVSKSVDPGTGAVTLTFGIPQGAQGERGLTGATGSAGEAGVSPAVSVAQITGGHRVTIVDADGSRVFDVMDGAAGQNGAPGQDGVSPTATVTQTSTGATISITDKTGTTTAQITNGQDGAQGSPGTPGTPGADGVSPSVTVTDITGGHRVTITDATGAHTFDVMDGEGGGAAENGLPTGGTTGQVLKKTGSADYAAGWSDVALDDLSNVNINFPYQGCILTFNDNKWGVGPAIVSQCGFVDEDIDYDTGDPTGTYAIFNASCLDPMHPQYVRDGNSYVMTHNQHEVYWTSNFDDYTSDSAIYLIDRASGTPFNRSIKRFAYNPNTDTYAEAPLALANEVTGMWTGTQAQYDALATKDAHTVYFIQE